jgi:hypothetical protein
MRGTAKTIERAVKKGDIPAAVGQRRYLIAMQIRVIGAIMRVAGVPAAAQLS